MLPSDSGLRVNSGLFVGRVECRIVDGNGIVACGEYRFEGPKKDKFYAGFGF